MRRPRFRPRKVNPGVGLIPPLDDGPDVHRLAAEDAMDTPPLGEVRKAKGKALDRSEAQLEQAAKVTGRDINAAREDWRAKTLPEYRGLIEAQRED